MQLDRSERIDKLEETLGAVEADYARLLRETDKRASGKVAENNGNGPSMNGGGASKRPSPDEGVEDDGEPSAKKVKFT